MYNINREELAWAAGFWDGEGCTSLYLSKKTGLSYLKMGVTQFYNQECLERLQRALNGLGKVRGPFRRSSSSAKKKGSSPDDLVRYHYQINTYEEVQQALCLLWPWLSNPKREQAIRRIKEWHTLRQDVLLKFTKVSPLIITQLIDEKMNGAKQQDLAKKYNLNRVTVGRLTAGHGNWKRHIRKGFPGKRGETNPKNRFTEDQVREMIFLVRSGMTQTEVAKRFNTRQGYIANLMAKRLWAHLWSPETGELLPVRDGTI